MNQQLNDMLESYREELVRNLQDWVRVPSVKGRSRRSLWEGDRGDDGPGGSDRPGHGL